MEQIHIDKEQCNRDIRTYGDVIRHMTNNELALFLESMNANIELGILAIMRAKRYPHTHKGEEPKLRTDAFRQMYHFMNNRIDDENDDEADIWGIESWYDLCQWESGNKKNFGMDVVY